jgi:UBX domain-containing protein 1
MKGRSLGTTTVVEKKEENPVEQPKIEPILKPEIKEKTLMITFYKNGFQVDEGEFRSYENPENQAILKALNDGVVPQSLLPGVDRNTMISCQLVDKKSEIFEPPKESFKAFKGEGRSMSGGNVEKIEVKTDVQLTFKVDESKPVTTLQIRLPGGKAVKAVFNLHHTVSILRSYITS